MIFDVHTHYDDEAFEDDRDSVLKEINENGVMGILNCGTSMEGSISSVELAKKYDFVYAAVGIHPEYASIVDQEVIVKLKELSTYPKVKAIGEIGLDYHYDDNPPKETQKLALRKQMDLARALHLPVIIHDREAHEDTLAIIKEFKGVIGEIHSFSGSVEFAKECLKLGYYLGFTGVVTFKNAKKALEVLKYTPMERILVETDCPYMTPEPFRGKRNKSDYVKYILEKAAEVKETTYQEMACRTILNVKELLSL